MARGTPDGGFQQYITGANISDLGWMTYMLWGFAPLDSLGRPVYLDTFNNGLAAWTWTHDGASAANPAIFGGREVFISPNAVRFNAGTVGPIGAGSDSILTKAFHLRTPPRAGLEIAWQFGSGSAVFEQFMQYEFSPTQFMEASVRFDTNTSQWSIETNSGYVTILTDGNFGGMIAVSFVQVKLVVDFATGKYVRAIIGQQAFDLSAYTMPIFTFSQMKGSLIATLIAWGDGVHQFVNAGYVLLTKDEP